VLFRFSRLPLFAWHAAGRHSGLRFRKTAKSAPVILP
jgi:hypothetical protein